MSEPGDSSKPSPEKAEVEKRVQDPARAREARLASALRANLRRRKSAARVGA